MFDRLKRIVRKPCSPAGPKVPKGKRGRNLPDSAFDPKQLRKGSQVELEHTNDHAEARRIAKDHLAEDPRYYKALTIMEKHLDRTRCRK